MARARRPAWSFRPQARRPRPDLPDRRRGLSPGRQRRARDRPHVVVEADEYARAFLEYSPDIALVTNVEPDHLDYYGSYDAVKEAFRGFVSNVKPGGTLLLCADNAEAMALSDSLTGGAVLITYALDAPADYRASLIEDTGGMQHFNVSYKDERLGSYAIQLAARHNVQNALGVLIICRTLGLTDDEIRAGLAAYTGVRRRFEFVGETGGVLLMDDYAHHPTEVSATSPAPPARASPAAASSLCSSPTPTRAPCTCSKAGRPASAASTACSSSRPTPRVSRDRRPHRRPARRVPHDPPATYCADLAAAVDALAAELRPGDVFFTVGAGDVDFVGPCFCNACNRQVCDNDPSRTLRGRFNARNANLPLQPWFR